MIVVQFNDSSKAETSSIINKTETKETGKAEREKEHVGKRRKAIRMRKIDRVIIEKRSFEASGLDVTSAMEKRREMEKDKKEKKKKKKKTYKKRYIRTRRR